MPAGRTNKFARARQHLRSSSLDEKLQMLSEIPTNNTSSYYEIEPDVFETIPAVRAPLDLTADDASQLGKDTSGLFDSAGNPLTESPPGDNSYILGPMVSVYFPDGDYSAIGYIQKDTRKVINLARIPGTVSGWGVGGNVEGFTSYSQLTVEQALWYRDKLINGDTSDYRVFYVGVFEQLNSETDVTDPSTGVDVDEFGRWIGQIIADGYISEPERQELIQKGKSGPDPDMPPGIANPAFLKRIEEILKKAPGTLTLEDEAYLIAAGLDDFITGGKTQSPLGDLGLLGLTYAGVKGAFALGLSTLAKIFTGVSVATQVEPFIGTANDASDYNKQLAAKLTSSILSGVPAEIKLSPEAAQDQINSIDLSVLSDILTIGGEAPEPSANSTINPGNKGQLLTGGWGVQGASEVHYDPATDTLTITSEKTLRTTSGGNTVTVDDNGKITSFSDIPSPSPEKVNQIVSDILKLPVVDAAYSALGSLAPTPDPTNPTGTINAWDAIKNDPVRLQQFTKDVASLGLDAAETGIQGTASNAVAIRTALTSIGVPASEIEKMGGAFGQVYSQTSYSGDQIPADIRNAINAKSGSQVSENRNRILRDIKKPYAVPEIIQEKVKHRPKVIGTKSVGDGLMKKAEVPTSFKRIEDTMWKKQERAQNARFSQERKNMILDSVGTSDHAWEYITDRSASGNEAKIYENFGQGIKNKIIEKKKIGNDYIIKMYNEEGNVETITQSVLNERLQKQYELTEQQTLNAPDDPIIKRVRDKLLSKIDYEDKPAVMGYPNTPPPKLKGGFHPQYGDRQDYYNRLDRYSADTMSQPLTGNEKIDSKVLGQTTSAKLNKIIRKIRQKNQPKINNSLENQ